MIRQLLCFHKWEVLGRYVTHRLYGSGITGERIISRCVKCGCIKQDKIKF